MKKYLIAGFLIFNIPLFAQINTDSLKTIWTDNSLGDSIRLEAVNLLAWEGHLFTDPDSAFYFAQQQYDFAKARGMHRHMAVARNTQGTSFYMVGNYAKAIDYFYKSLRVKESINDHLGMAATLNNIAMIQDDQGDYDKAINLYLKAIENVQKIDGYNEREDAKKTLAASYHNLGALYLSQNDHQKALEYFNSTLHITNEMDFKRERAYAYGNLGHIYMDKQDVDAARIFYQKGYDILVKIGDESGIIDALSNFAYLYHETGDYHRAIGYATRALNMARDNASYKDIQAAADYLYSSYKNLGQYKKSLEMLEVYRTAQDSVHIEENRNEVIRQEYEYAYQKQVAADSVAFAARQKINTLQIAKQQAQLKSAQAQSFTLYAIIILSIILVVVAYRGYRRKIIDHRTITLQKHEVERQRDEISTFNTNLEEQVRQRTMQLEKSLTKIRNYQYDLAHNIRAPFVTLIGLLNLIDDPRFDSAENKVVLEKLRETSVKVTTVLKNISSELEEFDWEKNQR